MNYLDILHAQLRVDEGTRFMPYPDAKGKISIGIGRNLTDNGINKGEIALMFSNDLQSAEDTARRLVPTFDSLSDVRKSVMVNLAFNMGYNVLAQFVNTLKAVGEKRWGDAATDLLASKAANDAPLRFKRLSEALRTNVWLDTA